MPEYRKYCIDTVQESDGDIEKEWCPWKKRKRWGKWKGDKKIIETGEKETREL